MAAQQDEKFRTIVSSLRARARSLRRQAHWIQQQVLDTPMGRVTPDAVLEIQALREESRELSSLATQYERRLSRKQAAAL